MGAVASAGNFLKKGSGSLGSIAGQMPIVGGMMAAPFNSAVCS